MNKSKWIEKLTKEGFNVSVCPLEAPNTDFGEHTHQSLTVHVILLGELILTDKNGTKVAKEGERFEIPAGTTHRAKCGSKGCRFIVGVKI